jgi:HEAT repeat protein
MIYNNDPTKAAYAIRWLGKQKTNDMQAIEALLERLGDERDTNPVDNNFAHVRAHPVGDTASEALSEIGRPAIPALIKFLRSDAKPAAKIRGLRVCESFGTVASEAFPAIAELTNASGELELRYRAYAALAAVTTEPERLLAVLEPAFEDKDPNIQSIAIIGLASAGPAAKKLVPTLSKLLDSNAERVEWYAPDAAGTVSLSVDAAEALAKLGTAATAALPHLKLKLEDKDGRVRMAAAYAHASISGERTPGIDLLLKELSNQQDRRQNAENYAADYLVELARQGKFAETAANAFRGSLQHQDAGVRMQAIRGLAILKPADAVTLLRLVAEKDSSIIVQDDAKRAIQELSETKQPSPKH